MYSKAQKGIKCSTCIEFFIHCERKFFLLIFSHSRLFIFFSHYGQQKVVKLSVSSRHICFPFRWSLSMTSFKCSFKRKACGCFNHTCTSDSRGAPLGVIISYLQNDAAKKKKKKILPLLDQLIKTFHTKHSHLNRAVRRGEWIARWLFHRALWHKEKRRLKLQQKMKFTTLSHYLALWSLDLGSVGFNLVFIPVHTQQRGRKIQCFYM